jgi:hypothetical protein
MAAPVKKRSPARSSRYRPIAGVGAGGGGATTKTLWLAEVDRPCVETHIGFATGAAPVTSSQQYASSRLSVTAAVTRGSEPGQPPRSHCQTLVDGMGVESRGTQTLVVPEKPALVVTVSAVDPLKADMAFPEEKNMRVNVICVAPAALMFPNWTVPTAEAVMGPETTTFVPGEVLRKTGAAQTGQEIVAQFRS